MVIFIPHPPAKKGLSAKRVSGMGLMTLDLVFHLFYLLPLGGDDEIAKENAGHRSSAPVEDVFEEKAPFQEFRDILTEKSVKRKKEHGKDKDELGEPEETPHAPFLAKEVVIKGDPLLRSTARTYFVLAVEMIEAERRFPAASAREALLGLCGFLTNWALDCGTPRLSLHTPSFGRLSGLTLLSCPMTFEAFVFRRMLCLQGCFLPRPVTTHADCGVTLLHVPAVRRDQGGRHPLP